MNPSKKPRELTGRHVLLWIVGFFAVVFAVNGVLVRAATSTFGGLETQSSYKAGLMFEQEVAKAERQDELNGADNSPDFGHDGILFGPASRDLFTFT